MDGEIKVNFRAIDLAYYLLVFDSREDYTRSIAYQDDIEEEPLRKATDRWGDCGEYIFRAFLLLHEGVTLLKEERFHGDGSELRQSCASIFAGSQLDVSGKRKVLQNDQEKTLLQVDEGKHGETDIQWILRNNYQPLCVKIEKNSFNTHPSESEITENDNEMISLSSSSKLSDRLQQRRRQNRVPPLCEPESDLTATEDESDTFRLSKIKTSLQVPSFQVSDPPAVDDQLILIPKSKFVRTKNKIDEVKSLLEAVSRTLSRSSPLREIAFYRLSIAGSLLSCVDDPTSGICDCKRLVSELNSLPFVQNMFTRGLETPQGIKAQLAKKLNVKKFRKVMSTVHFINYMTWKWLILANKISDTGLALGIPNIKTALSSVHPTDDWRVRDECQTCVEFVGKIPSSCTLAVNSKDQLVIIDARNCVTVYTIAGKPLLSFKASTSQHPHSRWIIGVDELDNIYVGSTLGILCETRQPLSVFTSTGDLLCEPELGGCRGKYHFYAVTKTGLILMLSVATSLGNMVSVYKRDSKLVNSFLVREIVLPRFFNAAKDTIIVGGVTAKESKDFAFQIFDQLGQQLFFIKPEVSFQHCEVDPWTGSIVLVKTDTLRDFRYCVFNTVVLTGEIHVLAPDGQSIKSNLNLRWPFRVVAGVTVLKCGLVAIVTMDEPYYAIHVI